jgi:hypothetical protein
MRGTLLKGNDGSRLSSDDMMLWLGQQQIRDMVE